MEPAAPEPATSSQATVGDGIAIENNDTEDILVQGNRVGTDTTGSVALGNGGNGIRLSDGAKRGAIGGSASGAANVIAFNGLHGVLLEDLAGDRNPIQRNSIHSNGGLGIDLGDDGITPNDLQDNDDGPNRLQNFPRLSAAASDGLNTTIVGSLHSEPNATYVLEFFSGPNADPGGYGGGTDVHRLRLRHHRRER